MQSPPPPLRLAGFTVVPHIEMIGRVRDAIVSAGGCILDSTMFSNAMLAVSLELAPADLPVLGAALESAGLHLDPMCRGLIADGATQGAPGERENVSLSINFVHGDPPLRIQIPAVPG